MHWLEWFASADFQTKAALALVATLFSLAGALVNSLYNRRMTTLRWSQQSRPIGEWQAQRALSEVGLTFRGNPVPFVALCTVTVKHAGGADIQNVQIRLKLPPGCSFLDFKVEPFVGSVDDSPAAEDVEGLHPGSYSNPGNCRSVEIKVFNRRETVSFTFLANGTLEQRPEAEIRIHHPSTRLVRDEPWERPRTPFTAYAIGSSAGMAGAAMVLITDGPSGPQEAYSLLVMAVVMLIIGVGYEAYRRSRRYS